MLTAAVAERHGEQVAAVVADALGSDPLETALPAKLPGLPARLRGRVRPSVRKVRRGQRGAGAAVRVRDMTLLVSRRHVDHGRATTTGCRRVG
ncbi:hypothetical protein [Kitasatospora phosalacinea]|uniref:hypothetical protein n=1 Tax=Kitasatospora phosalacinea TaxID=2065 RepID=UPI00052460BF|nr:hypothetical protein [Kitasatospora phosalacinea]